MSTRMAPLGELVNLPEMEQMARLKLSPEIFAGIAEGSRTGFDRITFRPKVLIDSTRLDLTLTLLGEKHFAPVLVAPLSGLGRFHAEGDAALEKGAAAAKAGLVTAIAADADPGAVKAKAQAAAGKGAKAVCLSLGTSPVAWTWDSIGRFRKDLEVPVIVKGVLTPGEAELAVREGIDAIAVSAWRQRPLRSAVQPVEVLPEIAAAVAGRIPVLADGGFRRGTDVFKALAFGARAVMIGRPVVWGLAAYGASGVQYVLEMLQTELARTMIMCGTPNLAAIGREFVRVHKR